MVNETKGRVGILVGGGPAPGINGVIGAATIEAVRNGLEVVGIIDGFKWLMEGDAPRFQMLDIGDVSQPRVRGGSILHTSRANPTKEAEKDLPKVVAALCDGLKLDYLVTIGGDDTASSASAVAKAAGGRLRVAHVPKTIDNDLPLPGDIPTFGFQTARTLAAELLRNLVEDARTTRRWYVAVLMGRTAGHLALGSGNVAGATLTLIPEEFAEGECTLDRVCATIEGAMAKAKAVGHGYGVACVAEGVGELMAEELEAKYRGNPLVEFKRDDHNHLRLADVPLGDIFKRELKDRAKARNKDEELPLVAVTIGYDLRCATPIPFDAEYTQQLGWGAIRFLLGAGPERFGAEHGAMISVQGGSIVPMAFDSIRQEDGKTVIVRRVKIDTDAYRAARANMIRLERSDFADPAGVEKLAEAAGMSPADFREKFGPVIGS